MLRLRTLSAMLLTLALVGGCGDSGKTGGDKPKAPSASESRKGEASTTKPTTSGDKTPIETDKLVTIKGKVSYDGTAPARAELKIPDDNQDKAKCMAPGCDSKDQLWIVGGDGGVANVVVFLRAPQGKFFKVGGDLGKRGETVTMDQPCCVFVPHVVSLFPSYFDADKKEQVKTGQKFQVKNSAAFQHNTSYVGNPLVNPSVNQILAPGKEIPAEVKPGSAKSSGAEDLVNISCDIHKWMNAKAVVFDHPFHAVTNDKGEFELKVPAGTEVNLCVWHESMGDLKKATSETKTFKDGDTLALKVK